MANMIEFCLFSTEFNAKTARGSPREYQTTLPATGGVPAESQEEEKAKDLSRRDNKNHGSNRCVEGSAKTERAALNTNRRDRG